jgi:hypothetical protein
MHVKAQALHWVAFLKKLKITEQPAHLYSIYPSPCPLVVWCFLSVFIVTFVTFFYKAS